MAEPVGKLNVEIDADLTKLRQRLEDAKAEAVNAGDTIEGAGKKAGDGFAAAGAKIKESTFGLRSITGAIVGIIGLVTRWLAILGLIVAAFRGIVAIVKSVNADIKKSAELQQQHLEAVRAVADGMRKASDIAAVTAEFQAATADGAQRELEIRAKLASATVNPITGASSLSAVAEQRLREELKRLEEVRVQAAERAASRVAEIEREADAKREADAAESINRIAAERAQAKADEVARLHQIEEDARKDAERAARDSAKRGVADAIDALEEGLTEEEQIRARANRRILELEEALRNATSEEDKSVIEDGIEAIRAKAEESIAALRSSANAARAEIQRVERLPLGGFSPIGPVGNAGIMRDILREVQRTRRTVARSRA